MISILIFQGREYLPFLSIHPREWCKHAQLLYFAMNGVGLSARFIDRNEFASVQKLKTSLPRLLKGACGLELACKDHQDAQAVLTHYAPQVDCGIALSEEELRELEKELLSCMRLIGDTAEPRNQFSQIQHQLYQALHNMDIEGLNQSLAAAIEKAAESNFATDCTSLAAGIDNLLTNIQEKVQIQSIDKQINLLRKSLRRVSEALLQHV